MSSPPTINRFKGTGWEECNEFILAIRAAAWREGKSRDTAWMADFAGLHISHKALTWHSRLPQDVREDWSKLQVALLERWTPPEDEDEPRIEPTPAAAPSLNRADRADRPLQGVLNVAIEGSKTRFYFKLDGVGCGAVTENANEALRFRCSSLSNTTILERIDGTRHFWLTIHWSDSSPEVKDGSLDFGYLVLVDSLSLKSSWVEALETPYQLASCTVSVDGEVIPSWENHDTIKIPIGIFCKHKHTGGQLFLAADASTYSKEYSDEGRVKLFIKPIE